MAQKVILHGKELKPGDTLVLIKKLSEEKEYVNETVTWVPLFGRLKVGTMLSIVHLALSKSSDGTRGIFLSFTVDDDERELWFPFDERFLLPAEIYLERLGILKTEPILENKTPLESLSELKNELSKKENL